MTALGRFRPRVRVTTGPTGTEAAGSPATTPENSPEIDWTFSIRESLWEFGARIAHLWGDHTFVDREVWTVIKGPDGVEEEAHYFDGQTCWVCGVSRQ